jgi:hypothetical protein
MIRHEVGLGAKVAFLDDQEGQDADLLDAEVEQENSRKTDPERTPDLETRKRAFSMDDMQNALDLMLDWIDRALQLGAPDLQIPGRYFPRGRYVDHPAAQSVRNAYNMMHRYKKTFKSPLVENWSEALAMAELRRAAGKACRREWHLVSSDRPSGGPDSR